MGILCPELIFDIFPHLDLAGIKSLRLTCKQYATIGLTYLLKHISVRFERGFAPIISIAEQSEAAKKVRSLTYSRALLEPEFIPALLKSKIYNPKRKDRVRFQVDLNNESERIIREDEDFTAFQNSFAKFRKLESINVICGAPIDFEDYYLCRWSDKPRSNGVGVRELSAIQKAVLHARRKIKLLFVEHLDSKYFDQTTCQVFGLAWAFVTTLDLRLIPNSDELWQQKVKGAVQQLVQLRELHLRFCWCSESGLTPLSSVLDWDFTWPNLAALTLQGVVSDIQYFIESMETGLAKINCLTLSEFRFSVPDLQPILIYIRQRGLKKVNLLLWIESAEDLYEDDGEQTLQQIVKWLLNPRLPWPLTDAD